MLSRTQLVSRCVDIKSSVTQTKTNALRNLCHAARELHGGFIVKGAVIEEHEHGV